MVEDESSHLFLWQFMEDFPISGNQTWQEIPPFMEDFPSYNPQNPCWLMISLGIILPFIYWGIITIQERGIPSTSISFCMTEGF
jgi:hypothetical protein